MSVDREFRNQGVGRRLLEAMLAWARENPILEKLTIKVHADNDRAIHLYLKVGFFKEGLLKKELRYDSNEYVDTLILSTWV